MFRREKSRFLDGKPIDPMDATTTVVGEGAVFTGDITSSGDVVIGGAVQGNVETSARMHIKSTGSIQGSVNAVDAKLEGTVEGPVMVSGKLEIGCTARVFGEVRAGRLAIAEGSLVQGSLHTETPAHHFVESRNPSAAERRHAMNHRFDQQDDELADRAEQLEEAEDTVEV